MGLGHAILRALCVARKVRRTYSPTSYHAVSVVVNYEIIREKSD